jgi:hypothetical protein
MARKRRKASAGKRRKKSRTAIRKTARPGVKKRTLGDKVSGAYRVVVDTIKGTDQLRNKLSLQQLRKRSNSAADAPHSKASNVAMAIVVQRDHQCPLWVKSRHVQCKRACPLCPRKRTFEGALTL